MSLSKVCQGKRLGGLKGKKYNWWKGVLGKNKRPSEKSNEMYEI